MVRRFPRLVLSLIAAAWTMAAGAADVPPGRNSDGKKFVHPGIFYTQGDFDRMRAMVAAGKEPWKRCFEGLKSSRWTGSGAFARGRGGEIPAGGFNATIGFDGRHAHDLALMWKLTDDEAYAVKVRDILIQSANYTGASWAGTGPLDNGKIYLLVEAAEMMRDYPGWAKEDRERFAKVLREVFYPHICNGDIMRWGNQGLTAWHGVLAMAIFLDDVKMYDRVWNCVMGRAHREDDAPYPSGGVWKPDWPANYGEFFVERTKPPSFGDEQDFAYDDRLQYYVYANGQGEESCRDQPHAMYGLFQMVSLAEIFWNQGDDLYGALDNRILLGIEWSLRYNMSDWEPKGYTDKEEDATFENELFYRARTRNSRWTALKPSTHGRGSDGGPAAPKMAALMHYAVRRGVPSKKCEWLKRTVARQHANGGFETWGFGANWYYEWEGWGTLTKTRTRWMQGDPVTWKGGERISGAHKVPCAFKAIDYDFFPCRELPQSRFADKPCLAPLARGEQALYTLSVPEAGKRAVAVYYRSLGALRLSASVDDGDEVAKSLPKCDGIAHAEIGEIEFPSGACVLRLKIENAAAASLFAVEIR